MQRTGFTLVLTAWAEDGNGHQGLRSLIFLCLGPVVQIYPCCNPIDFHCVCPRASSEPVVLSLMPEAEAAAWMISDEAAVWKDYPV